jgi:hypothetical protein
MGRDSGPRFYDVWLLLCFLHGGLWSLKNLKFLDISVYYGKSLSVLKLITVEEAISFCSEFIPYAITESVRRKLLFVTLSDL